MSVLSINAKLRFTLNGTIVDAPVEWKDISIVADFQDGENQPTISIESFTFVDEGAQVIRQWILDGKGTRGLPFKIDTYNATGNASAFDGFLNLTDGYEEFDDGSVKAKLIKVDGRDLLNDRLAAITYPFLESIGVITNADYTNVDYVVEKNNNIFEILISSVVLFLMIKELGNQIRSLSTSVTNAIAHVTGGISGSVAGAVFAIAMAIIQVLYTALVVIAIINLAIQLFESLLPIVRTHKTIKLRTALSKAAAHIGYTLVSPIPELDTYHYLPSNKVVDDVSLLTGLITFPKGTQKGIPQEGDFGYTAAEMFILCKRMFHARIKIIGNELHFRSENDPFWFQPSSYQMRDTLLPVQRYNFNEIIFSKLLKFDTDPIADIWTNENFKGTNYEIITDDPTITNVKEKFIKNHETVPFLVALGNRKDELNALESSLSDLAQQIDKIVDFFGGSSNFQASIDNKVGMLKVGTNNTTKPKILVLTGANKLPSNHRSILSAKFLYDKYINEGSFVLNNFKAQKKLYPLDDLGFGFEDFIETIENSTFTDTNNILSKFRTAEWKIAADQAVVEFEQHHIHSPNLKETYIEVTNV